MCVCVKPYMTDFHSVASKYSIIVHLLFQDRITRGIISLFHSSVCVFSSGAYAVMLSHPNVVFLAKRGTSKPFYALPAPRTRSHIQVP